MHIWQVISDVQNADNSFAGDKKKTKQQTKTKTQPLSRQFVTKNVDVKRSKKESSHFHGIFPTICGCRLIRARPWLRMSTFSSPTNSCGNSSTLIVFHLPPPPPHHKLLTGSHSNIYTVGTVSQIRQTQKPKLKLQRGSLHHFLQIRWNSELPTTLAPPPPKLFVVEGTALLEPDSRYMFTKKLQKKNKEVFTKKNRRSIFGFDP